MKKLSLIGLALALMSVSALAQTRRPVTYNVKLNNCSSREIVVSFSKKLTTENLMPITDDNNKLVQRLKRANGIQDFGVDGNDIVIIKSDGVSAETAVSNVVVAVEKHFGWRATQQNPTSMANHRCLSNSERQAIMEMFFPRRRNNSRSTGSPNPTQGPRRVPNGPIMN